MKKRKTLVFFNKALYAIFQAFNRMYIEKNV